MDCADGCRARAPAQAALAASTLAPRPRRRATTNRKSQRAARGRAPAECSRTGELAAAQTTPPGGRPRRCTSPVGLRSSADPKAGIVPRPLRRRAAQSSTRCPRFAPRCDSIAHLRVIRGPERSRFAWRCGKICRAPCFRHRACRFSGFTLRNRHHPREVSLDPSSGQGARRHWRPADDRARVPARRRGPFDRAGDRRHRRRADRGGRARIWRRSGPDVDGASERDGSAG